MKRKQGQTFVSHLEPGWLGHAHGESCWDSQTPSQGKDYTLADWASSFLSLERCHGTSSPRDRGCVEFFPGLQLCSPLHALSALGQQLAGQTDKPSISLRGEECETQSRPTVTETKTAKKSSGAVQDFSPRPWGNVGPEKSAAATVKITVLGRDGESWGGVLGRGSTMWLRCPVSHLGHEQVPALPMAGVGGLMYGSGEAGEDGSGPQACSCHGCRGDAPGRLKEMSAELCKWV